MTRMSISSVLSVASNSDDVVYSIAEWYDQIL